MAPLVTLKRKDAHTKFMSLNLISVTAVDSPFSWRTASGLLFVLESKILYLFSNLAIDYLQMLGEYKPTQMSTAYYYTKNSKLW